MSNEMIAILGVGVVLGLFNWRVSRSDKADAQKHSHVLTGTWTKSRVV